MLLIGSRAAKIHFDDFPREPKDSDYVVFQPYDFDGYIKSTGMHGKEYMKIPPIEERYHYSDVIISADHLYTLKLSHIFWHPDRINKHLFDINFLKSKGCIKDQELFNELYLFWNEVHGFNRRTDFDQPNDTFFVDKVVRQYEHDDLHKIINPKPIYETIKHDIDNADIDEDLFDQLDWNSKLELVREEAYVLALERIYLTGNNKNYRVSFAQILRAMINRLSPLWLAVFIAENFNEINKPIDYIKHFETNKNK